MEENNAKTDWLMVDAGAVDAGVVTRSATDRSGSMLCDGTDGCVRLGAIGRVQ